MKFGFNAPTAGPMSATDQLVRLVVEGGFSIHWLPSSH